MNDFDEFETIIHLMRLGNFSATAEKMHTTQSNISKRVGKIESNLGVPLIAKSGRVLKPTLQGEVYLDYARKILELREEMLRKIENPVTKRGKIRVGCSETIVFILLSSILKDFRLRYSNIQLDLQVDISRNLKQQLIEEKIDIAFLIGGAGDPNFIDIPMINYEMGWFVSKDAELGRDLKVILESQPLITFSRDTAPYHNLIRAINEKGLRYRGIHNCSSLSTLINLTLTDNGVGVFPSAIGMRAPWKNKLKKIKGLALPPLDYYVSFLDHPNRTELRDMADIALKIADKKETTVSEF